MKKFFSKLKAWIVGCCQRLTKWLSSPAAIQFAVRLCVIAVMLFVGCPEIFADASAGAGGFSSAATTIRTYQEPIQTLLNAIAAVIVLVGAFNIFFKMQNSDQDVKKTIMMTVGGCVAFLAASASLPLFFT